MDSMNTECPECKREEAKISPVIVLSVENQGILNAIRCVLEIYNREPSLKLENKLRDMIHVLPQLASHYRKKEDLFLPCYQKIGFEEEAEKHRKMDLKIQNQIHHILNLEKQKSPYEFREEYLNLCKSIVILAKEENTEFLIQCYHNFTQDEMDAIGKRIPSYGYTFLSVEPKPEDLISRVVS